MSPWPTDTARSSVAFQFELVGGQRLGQHRGLGQFAGEAGLPVGGQAGVGGLERGAPDDLGGGDAAGLGEVLLEAGQADPVVLVAVGDVDAGDALAEAAHPLGECVDLVEGDERVDEDALLGARDQGAGHG